MEIPTPMPETLEQKTARFKRLGRELLSASGALHINLDNSGYLEVHMSKERFKRTFAGMDIKVTPVGVAGALTLESVELGGARFGCLYGKDLDD